mmetsp:Transcript_45326/g.96424  ORF Transcript_45326/g.96424 Transcript_45326/m.96424 type:complete len:82 (+) Transcript_45326:75-320(+)
MSEEVSSSHTWTLQKVCACSVWIHGHHRLRKGVTQMNNGLLELCDLPLAGCKFQSAAAQQLPQAKILCFQIIDTLQLLQCG